jgi:hypothetical protein
MKTWPFWLLTTATSGAIAIITGRVWVHGHPDVSDFKLVFHIFFGFVTIALFGATVINVIFQEFRRGKASQ